MNPRKFLQIAFSLLVLIACAPAASLSFLSTSTGLNGVIRLPEQAYGSRPRQTLDVYQPQNPQLRNSNGLHPVIVFAYGGGFKEGSKNEYTFVAQAFSSIGYTTVIFDYQLYPQVQWPTYLEDAALAVAWVRREIGKYGGDAKRMILAGHSAGAYIAAMLAVNPEYLRAANVPDGTIKTVLTFSGGYAFWDANKRSDGGYPNRELEEVMPSAELAAQTQPINFVGTGTPVFVMVHGTKDSLLKVEQARAMKRKLELAKVRVIYLEYAMSHAETILSIAGPLRGLGSTFVDVSAALEKLGY